MPFYLAIPRNATFSGAVQKGSMVKSDFVRTQPSQLLYNIVSEHSGPMYPLLAEHLGAAVFAFIRASADSSPHGDYLPRCVLHPRVAIIHLHCQLQGNLMTCLHVAFLDLPVLMGSD